MGSGEARKAATQKLDELRVLSYNELVEMLIGQDPVVGEMATDSGSWVQFEVQGLWDGGKRSGDLRVIVSVDEGGVEAFRPATDDFIIRPDGSFID